MGKRTPPSENADVVRLRQELEVHRVELERQHDEVEAAHDHYRRLYELAPIGYFTLDLDGRISAVNGAGAALLGRPRKEIAGERLANFLECKDQPAYHDFLTRMVFPEGTEVCTLSLPRPDGSRVIVRLDGRFDAAGREFLVAALDVTERAKAEADLEAARDVAEQANRAKSAFLANMSHEMRTPLHIIVGLGHLLRRALADTAEQQRIDQLCANSDHLLELINDVLDLSRIEAGRLTLDRRPFRLRDVLRRLLDVIDTPARSKGLELLVEADDGLQEATLLGDALRLAQILINLGSNAVKFTERGSIRVALECLAESTDGLTFRFTVQDSGIGIAPAEQARLFEVFSQADNSPTRAHGGSGLGLAISQRLVGMMGGRIGVDSQPGAGSRFSFDLVLPRGDGIVIEAPPPEPAAQLGGRRVLFAEDHPLSQEILFEMLEDLGCDVDVASDGQEAVDCAAERDFDLILMDMQMPKMDGLAATRAIRQLPRHRETPIIALTANAFAEDRQRCFEAGMNDHIGKPVTPATLGALLGRWLPSATFAAAAGDGASATENAAEEIAGLSPPASMRGSAQRIADYRLLLRRFAKAHGADMGRVQECLARGARDEAHRIVHDLKGISGLIGARRLGELSHEIVAALRADAARDVVAPLVAVCADELARLAAAIAQLPVPDTETND